MPKSDFAIAVDNIQRQLNPYLRDNGFKVRGRTYNRISEDGCTHVVNIQMGASDPPGTTYFPSLRNNLHGLFAINLGVYIPEVARNHGGGEIKSWVQEYYCCVRNRLGALVGEGKEIWWHADDSGSVTRDVLSALQSEGLPFFARFSTRDHIIHEWNGLATHISEGSPPRIVLAIIFCERGEWDEARQLLRLQVLETRNPGHPEYVRNLARRLGLGDLDREQFC